MSTQLTGRPGPASSSMLGDRVRKLRIARGLTQTDLSGERFSKEYLSQIERGKTRPTSETVAWLAQRLGVDATYLELGVSARERERIEAALARAEALSEKSAFQEAIDEIVAVGEALAASASAELELRALFVESWARMMVGEVRSALTLLERARSLAEGPLFTDLDRAEVLYRLGCCRVKLSSISTAVALLSEALELASKSGYPADRLCAHVFEWRARCYSRQRDWEAAREDVERALELARGLNDRHTMAHAYFQASLLAHQTGQYVLARRYAQSARDSYEELADRINFGRQLNNLGAFTFLLGRPTEAIAYLKEAFEVALDNGSDADAAQAVSSLAQVHQRLGEHTLAEEQARHAIKLLRDREDFLDEIGNAHLVLGRALLDQDRLDQAAEAFAQAEASFEQIGSVSHKASTWIARGDLAARRHDEAEAARLYRLAAETLQDFRF